MLLLLLLLLLGVRIVKKEKKPLEQPITKLTPAILVGRAFSPEDHALDRVEVEDDGKKVGRYYTKVSCKITFFKNMTL